MSKKYASLWIGSEPTQYEILSYLSHVRNGHFFSLYTYKKFNLPSSINQISADEIMPMPSTLAPQQYARYSDIFRYELLSRVEDCIWVDSDVVSMTKQDFGSNYVFSEETPNYFATGTLALPHDSHILSELKFNSVNTKEVSWASTGPKLFTRLVVEHGLQSKSLPKESLYSIGPWDIDLLVDPLKLTEAKHATMNAYSIHLYNEMLNRACVPKNVTPPQGSYLFQLLKEHDLVDLRLPQLDLRWLDGWRRNFKERKFLYKFYYKLKPLKPLISKFDLFW